MIGFILGCIAILFICLTLLKLLYSSNSCPSRSNSDSSVDEGIGPDILTDVSVSLQSEAIEGKNIKNFVSSTDVRKNSRPVENIASLYTHLQGSISHDCC